MSNYTSLPIAQLRGLTPLFNALCDILPGGAWIAGGALEGLIRNREIKGYDIFFRDRECFEELVRRLDAGTNAVLQEYRRGKGWDRLDDPEQHYVEYESNLGRPAIQLVKYKFSDTIEGILDGFDFTCTQLGTDGSELIVNPEGLLHIAQRRLVINAVESPPTLKYRVSVYTKKGYRLDRSVNEYMTLYEHGGGTYLDFESSRCRS